MISVDRTSQDLPEYAISDVYLSPNYRIPRKYPTFAAAGCRSPHILILEDRAAAAKVPCGSKSTPTIGAWVSPHRLGGSMTVLYLSSVHSDDIIIYTLY